MKLFFAVRVPEELLYDIEEQLKPLKKKYPYFYWIPPENYHITVYYLGEYKEEKIPKLVLRSETALFEAEKVHLFSYGLDLFSNQKISIHIAMRRNKRLEKTNEQLTHVFGDRNRNKKRFPFTPHISIARYKIPSKQQYLHIAKQLHAYEFEIDFPVETVDLLDSVPNGSSPHYNLIHTFSLVESR